MGIGTPSNPLGGPGAPQSARVPPALAVQRPKCDAFGLATTSTKMTDWTVGTLPPLGWIPGPQATLLGVRLHPRVPVACRPKLDILGTTGPKAGARQNGPNTAQNHQTPGPAAPGPALAGSTVLVYGQNPLGQHLGCVFGCVLAHFAPKIVSVGPNLGLFGSSQAETKNWLHLKLDKRNRNSEDTCPLCKPHLWWFSPVRMAQMHR